MLQKRYNMAFFIRWRHFPDLIEFVKFSATIWEASLLVERVLFKASKNNKLFVLTYRGWAGFHENTDSTYILAS